MGKQKSLSPLNQERKKDISKSSHSKSRQVRLRQTAQVLIHTGLDTTTYLCHGALSTSNYNIY